MVTLNITAVGPIEMDEKSEISRRDLQELKKRLNIIQGAASGIVAILEHSEGCVLTDEQEAAISELAKTAHWSARFGKKKLLPKPA